MIQKAYVYVKGGAGVKISEKFAYILCGWTPNPELEATFRSNFQGPQLLTKFGLFLTDLV